MEISMTVLAPDRSPALRLFRHTNPAAALGMAVSHLMTKPAFARLPFGSWTRVLVGQINRGHYYLVLDARGRTVGFMGWAVTDKTTADAWLGGWDDPDGVAHGDCVIINAWSADRAGVNAVLLAAGRQVAAGHRLLYFKRHYPDGTSRNGRLTVPAAMQHGSADVQARKTA
jgi:hemolysin-activating ACP:hemolysin acyltransferase